MKGERLGEFEELVLLTVYGLGLEAYGVTILDKLEKDTERSVSIGAVYASLDRLEKKGRLRSNVGGATPERGGRRKRFFAVTQSGVQMLMQMRRIREKIWSQLDAKAPTQGVSR